MSMLTIQDRFEASILCGAIGDAWGSSYENEIVKDHSQTYVFGRLPEVKRHWTITDDTQMTLASCEALSCGEPFTVESLSQYFVRYYKQSRLSGLGSSTLKALTDLQNGIHWSLAGRSGEYAAGNGAAMRVAPFAFFEHISRDELRDICRITHRNDEAYVGALAVFLAIRAINKGHIDGSGSLWDHIIPHLPDTNVRDRMIYINSLSDTSSIEEIALLGTNSYVVNSVPFSIFAATKVKVIGLEQMFTSIIKSGGDTDTNASISGQIAGAILGTEKIPVSLLNKLQIIKEYTWIQQIVQKAKKKL